MVVLCTVSFSHCTIALPYVLVLLVWGQVGAGACMCMWGVWFACVLVVVDRLVGVFVHGSSLIHSASILVVLMWR